MCEFFSIFFVGYFALSTMISIAVVVTKMACLVRLDIELAILGFWNLRRFRDARLHAESSRNMYSEHGLEALMRAVLMHGCQSLMVVSN